MYFNSEGKAEVTYDAIVVGSGISGGWAAKELTEKGLKTLVLERGRNVEHIVDYPTMNMAPWDLPSGDKIPKSEIEAHYPKQNRTGYTIRKSLEHWWVKDSEQPYTEVKRFDWIRGYHVGGRSLLWGRQSYRLSEMDFTANAKEGVAVDWPVRYADMAPWYDYVESYIGVSGQNEGLAQLPDGNFLPPMELNCLERSVKSRIEAEFKDRIMTIGRTAHLTAKLPHGNRGQCQFRNLCMRGCPYGGYFSSNASTLPAATATGNLTLRPHSIVTQVVYDPKTGRATGVQVTDSETGETFEYFAKIVFLCASTLNSTAILMNSTEHFPEGMGNESGELGHNLMDHHFRVGATGFTDEHKDQYYSGRRPNGIYIPRFRNLPGQAKMPYLRGYGYQGGASREGWSKYVKEAGFGAELKARIIEPGPWQMGLLGFGECLPYHENKIALNRELLDKWGQPTLTIDCEFKENELEMRKDMKDQAAQMLEASGIKAIETYDDIGGPGLGIHEMGTARMGRDPKTSVLNKWNQVHAVKNVFVTDGSCMTSAGCQNPSLTYMALTARAADFAVQELKKGNL